jgi:RNA polymerase sigma-70 factor (ECF subfamily)
MSAAASTFEDYMTDRAGQPEPEVYLDQAALEVQNRFVSDNLRRVFLLIYRVVGNVDDAQDLTQEAFIKALQRQDQLKDLDKAAHWLSRIATNTAIDFLRRHGRVNFCEIDELIEPLSTPKRDSPEQLLLRAERREYLEAGLDSLTARERTALVLRDVEEMPCRGSRRAS